MEIMHRIGYEMKPIFDFHIHSLHSDGVLLPTEIARRLQVLNYKAIAITDHVDLSNIRSVLSGIVEVSKEITESFDGFIMIPGVELTHLSPSRIPKTAKFAKQLGAKIVIVHGETIVEPTIKGTNLAAVECSDVDILAHPGLIRPSEVEKGVTNEIFFELTSRGGHCLTNGHIAKICKKYKANMLVNSDGHNPHDFLTSELIGEIILGSGLDVSDVDSIRYKNPEILLKRINI